MRRRALVRSAVPVAALTVALVTAVGASAPTIASAAATTASGSACGVVPYKAPAGNAKLSSLPAPVKAAFSGYYYGVNASPLGHFKAKTKGPWTIGYADYTNGNGWHQDALSQLNSDAKRYKSQIKGIDATSSNFTTSLQIQQITNMINKKVGAIIALPTSPTAFNGVIKQAHQAGIPFITFDSYVTSPYAINLDNNGYLVAEKVAAGIAKMIGQKGNVLIVDGITGTPANTAFHAGFLAAFKQCPHITVAGSVEGQWSETATKAAVLQFLATHSGQINAVVDGGDESVGVIQAFQQSGRALVPIGDSNPDQGSLVALKQNLPSKYVASTDPPQESATSAVITALRVLEGQGPKYNVMLANPPLVSGPKELAAWTAPSWQESSVGATPNPPGTQWLPQTVLDNFFEHPQNIK